MAIQQEEGWPLGLRPLNSRVGLGSNRQNSGSISFSTLLTGSPTSSTASSSDLDTESTGSFFHDKSITLGNLIGISSILEISRRSTRGRTAETGRDRKISKPKPWLFSLCSKLSTDAVNNMNNAGDATTPSLGHFLEEERRCRRNPDSTVYETYGFSPTLPVSEPNSLFIRGQVAPQSNSTSMAPDGERRPTRELPEQDNDSGHGVPLLFSCLRGQLIE